MGGRTSKGEQKGRREREKECCLVCSKCVGGGECVDVGREKEGGGVLSDA